ncbi:arylsulfatase [Reichenbachiella sp. MALMAid0571]|uniref:arylsulfatase n=1 Tax=Reichenbachiella sp. MALMAid0571 TaxID=3143939 RepID=UPI0032DF6D1F
MPTIKLNIPILIAFLIIVGCQPEKKDVNTVKSKYSSPNIIYILADDLGYGNLSCLGQKKYKTPNIDKLAAEGMLFTQHYSGSTVCAPSRSSLMTGLHTGHTTIRGNKGVKPEGQYPINAEDFTIAEMLKKKGYATGAFGKWSLGNILSEGNPLKQGFDVFFGYNCQTLAHNYYPFHLWSNNQKIVLTENQKDNEGVYAPDLIHQKTLEFIDENKERPFFAYVPSIIPHAEIKVPEQYMSKYRGKLDPEVYYDGCDYGCDRYKIGGYGSQPEAHAAFAGMIDLLDQQVGEIVAKVKELGIEENTIIFFTSDNGPHDKGGADLEFFNSNGKFRGFKRDLYEGGIRVPMIVKWPGTIKKGSTTSHVSAFWDVLPTLADIAKISFSSDIDGISFLPTLLEKEQPKHEFLYWEFHEKGGRRAIRKDNFKVILYDVKTGKPKPAEVYDLDVDPYEQNDIASQHSDIIEEALLLMSTRSVSSVKEWNF